MKLDIEEQYNLMGHLQSYTGIMYSDCSVHAFNNFFICLHFTSTLYRKILPLKGQSLVFP